MALTVDDLGEFLNITFKDDTSNPDAPVPDPRRRELGEHLDAAVAVVEARTGPVWRRDVTLKATAFSGLLALPATDLIAITAVTGPQGEIDLATVASGVDLHLGLIYLPAGSPAGPYVVFAVAGSASPPADLVRAVLYVAGHLWESQRGRSSRPGALGEERTGPAWAIPYVAQALMEPYLLPLDARSA